MCVNCTILPSPRAAKSSSHQLNIPPHPLLQMAALNAKVRAQGALFPAYFLAYPLCSPSRTAILTGRMPHNHGFVTNRDLESSGFHPVQEQTTVNTWLQDAGYHTMLCGKYVRPGAGAARPPHGRPLDAHPDPRPSRCAR